VEKATIDPAYHYMADPTDLTKVLVGADYLDYCPAIHAYEDSDCTVMAISEGSELAWAGSKSGATSRCVYNTLNNSVAEGL
jgi:hypothetical protein